MTPTMISFIRRCHETKTESMTLEEVFDAIKNGGHGLKEKIIQIRNNYEYERDVAGHGTEAAKKAIAALKAELPGVLFSGTFSERNNAALVEYSGHLCADLDNLGPKLSETREALKDVPYVHAIMLSPSGDGLKVVFNVVPDPARHMDSFRAIKELLHRIDLEIDEKCKDLARICFFTYDPDLWVRTEDNLPIDPLPPEPKRTYVPPNGEVSVDERARAVLNLGIEIYEWNPEKGGFFCRCPGEGLHTNATGRTHTIFYPGGIPGEIQAPTLFCQHESCSAAIKMVNDRLRSEIGKAESKLVSHFTHIGVKRETNRNTTDPEEVTDWNQIFLRFTVSGSTFNETKMKRREPIVDDWFREGDLGYIFAPRGVGKTWLSMGLATVISSGSHLGKIKAPEGMKEIWKANKALPILYVDGEMPVDLMQDRSRGLTEIKGNSNFHLLHHELLFDGAGKVMNFSRTDQQQAITDYCINQKIKVLFLDNLSCLFFGMEENKADAWELVSPWLLDLRRRQISVVIIHHAGRNGQMRGTSRREDAVFWIISLTESRTASKDKRGSRFITRFTKESRNSQIETPAYEWHFVTGDKGIVSVGCKLAHSLEVFRQIVTEGVTDCGQIASEMGVSPATISRLAKQAMDAGWLEKRGRDYKLTITGEVESLEERNENETNMK